MWVQTHANIHFIFIPDRNARYSYQHTHLSCVLFLSLFALFVTLILESCVQCLSALPGLFHVVFSLSAGETRAPPCGLETSVAVSGDNEKNEKVINICVFLSLSFQIISLFFYLVLLFPLTC